MLASDEQARVIMSGSGPTTYEWVDLPVGPRELPPWVRGSEIRWMSGYTNSPYVSLKTWGYDDPRLLMPQYAMPGWYRQERPGFFVDRHPDGRVHHLSHDSPVRWITLKKFSHYETDAGGRVRYDRPVHEDYQAWATSKQGGFGGHTFRIREVVGHDAPSECPAMWTLDPDLGWWRWVELRGPWHSSPPRDCVECGSDMGGMTLRRDVFVDVFARYHPWHRLALVTESGVTTLDPVHSDWDVPKQLLPREHPARRDMNFLKRSA